MKVFGVITARAGSKRVKNKNLRELNGVPLIDYTFKCAESAKKLNRIILSTDDTAIIDRASRFNRIEVPFIRPSELATDQATDLAVFKHLLNYLLSQEESLPDILVHLRPTSPLRKPEHIDNGVDLLLSNPTATSVRSVIKSSVSVFKLYIENNKFLDSPTQPIYASYKDMPDQLIPRTLRHIGYFDAVRTRQVLEFNSMTGNRILPLLINDALPGINTEDDFLLYERIMRGTSEVSDEVLN